MTDPADPRHDEHDEDDTQGASEYDTLFRERAPAEAPEPKRSWWDRLFGFAARKRDVAPEQLTLEVERKEDARDGGAVVERAPEPEVAPAPPVVAEPIVEPGPAEVVPDLPVVLEPIVEPEEVATPPVIPVVAGVPEPSVAPGPPTTTDRSAPKRKRKRAKETPASESIVAAESTVAPEIAVPAVIAAQPTIDSPAAAPSDAVSATTEPEPALVSEPFAAPVEPPAPEPAVVSEPFAAPVEPPALEPAVSSEPFAAAVEPPAPEPVSARAIPRVREEDLPTRRPGPFYDPTSDVPVYTDEEIEAQIGPPPRRRRLVATSVIIVAALAAFGTGLFVFNNLVMPRFIHSTAEVTVPDLANLNYEQAELALKPHGLVLSRAGERFDPAVPRGFILSQDPPPETPVRGRKRVMVVVSLGEEFSSVPSLFGESLRSARFLLQRSGLRVTGITRAPSDEVGEGLVAGTDPPAETVLPRNATVALLVSSGTAKEEYVMPDLLGREIASVRRHLESLGFRVITPPAAPSVGAIVFQDPAAGSRISVDTPISLQATGRIIR